MDRAEQVLNRMAADNLNRTPVALTGKRNVNLSFAEEFTPPNHILTGKGGD